MVTFLGGLLGVLDEEKGVATVDAAVEVAGIADGLDVEGTVAEGNPCKNAPDLC